MQEPMSQGTSTTRTDILRLCELIYRTVRRELIYMYWLLQAWARLPLSSTCPAQRTGT